MAVKKQIVVRLDGKGKQGSFRKSSYSQVENIERMNEELAAAEESSDSKIHTFTRNYDTPLLSQSSSKSKSNFHIFKPIIIAIISAIIIGSIMGFIMLKIIVNFDNDLTVTQDYVAPTNGEENGNEGTTTTSTETSQYKIDAMSAYVLQGGVFSSVAGAEVESEKFVDAGYSPVIWEKDNQFFLLVDLGLSKEALQQDVTSLKESGIEVYAKEWQLSEQELELTKEEHEWIVSFQDKWKLSLETGNIEAEQWQQIVDQAPTQSEKLSSLVRSIEENVSADDKNTEGVLLKTWKTFATVLTTVGVE